MGGEWGRGRGRGRGSKGAKTEGVGGSWDGDRGIITAESGYTDSLFSVVQINIRTQIFI